MAKNVSGKVRYDQFVTHSISSIYASFNELANIFTYLVVFHCKLPIYWLQASGQILIFASKQPQLDVLRKKGTFFYLNDLGYVSFIHSPLLCAPKVGSL